jgi:signal transduction histidine kinase
MNLNFINIGLFSGDDQRLGYLNLIIEDPRRKIVTFKFKDISNKYVKFNEFDLLIFDITTFPTTNFKSLPLLRSEKKLIEIPFLYILKEKENSNIDALVKDKPAGIIQDPFTELEFNSMVTNLAALGDLQRQQDNHRDLLTGNNKLIYQIEHILQLQRLTEVSSIEEFYFIIQDQIVHKIELTFAAEKSIFFIADMDNDLLRFNEYSGRANNIKKQKDFKVHNSQVKSAIQENSPFILKEEMLLDPFIEELEEVIGFEINSLLFVPITVLQKPRGVLVIINKLYRRYFSENDLALSLIVLSKIIFRMESFYLKSLNLKEISAITIPGHLYQTEDYEPRFCRDILDTIGFGLIIFDRTYHLLYANKFAKNTFELDHIKKLILKDVLGDEAFEIINGLLNNRNVPLLRQEMLVNHPAIRQLYLGYSLYTISQNKENTVYALTFMEISQTKRIQAEIIRMDRMASLGVLASGIAHEIRNPLAGIKAMAQTLQEELGEADTRVEYIERIVRQVNRLDVLLKSFFSYARPQRPNPVRSKIPDIVREVLPLFRRKIKDNNIIIKEVYSKNLKEIFVDFHQIEQVFFNLIINAIDAMKDGGTLTIRARLPEGTQPIIDRRQRIPKLFSDIYNEITISDTGIGMDSETLNNMYNPFYTTKSNGTGLGLSIVYQIILEHGGQITVISELEKGTTFKILLPVYMKDQHPETVE